MWRLRRDIPHSVQRTDLAIQDSGRKERVGDVAWLIGSAVDVEPRFATQCHVREKKLRHKKTSCRTKPTHHCHAVVLQRWVSSAEARAEKGVEVDRAQLL